jgi:hypothetical protein
VPGEALVQLSACASDRRSGTQFCTCFYRYKSTNTDAAVAVECLPARATAAAYAGVC